MATPIFEQVQKKSQTGMPDRVSMMVVWVPANGPTLACAGCGVLAPMHSTDLDVLSSWADEHRARAHG